MAFMNEIYKFKKIFRDIEKATKKWVHLNGANEYKQIIFLVAFSIDRINDLVSGGKVSINSLNVILRFITIDVSNDTCIHYQDIK